MNSILEGTLFLSLIATGDAMAETINFDSFSTGALPTGWVCGVTGSGGSRWAVEPAADVSGAKPVGDPPANGGFPTLSQRPRVDLAVLRQHCLHWLVKAFFLPLMIGFFAADLTWLTKNPIEATLAPFFATPSIDNWLAIYGYFYDFLFLIDVGMASLGYIFTLKLFNSHIRSAEPTSATSSTSASGTAEAASSFRPVRNKSWMRPAAAS